MTVVLGRHLHHFKIMASHAIQSGTGRAFQLRNGKTWLLDLLAAVAADAVHPPLFYLLLKIWIGWGTSLLWLRLFPTLISVVAIAPFLLLCRGIEIA
jgi:hypothetical protein